MVRTHGVTHESRTNSRCIAIKMDESNLGRKRQITNSTGAVVTHANYTHLGTLIWISLLAGLIIPITAIII